MNLSGEWNREEFIRREEDVSHRTLEDEFSFYLAVKAGNVTAVQDNCRRKEFSKAVQNIQLSESPILNFRYHFITTTAMITRFCVEGGMELEQAYRLSDFYIRKMDHMDGEAEIIHLHDVMVLDYTEKMQELRKQSVLSRPVRLTIDYIYKNLHSRITLNKIAEQIGLSPSYLSILFRREMKQSIGDYINHAKIEAAANMLKFSDYTLSEIANYLDFSTQSYFVQVFRSVTGTTPGKYRKKHFRDEWREQ